MPTVTNKVTILMDILFSESLKKRGKTCIIIEAIVNILT